MPRVLLVPGRGKPRRGHWLQRWADEHPDHRWAPEPTGPPYVLDERLPALRDAVAADDEPAVLVAHSAGCLTTVVWAARHTGPVLGALLVAPPYVDPENSPDLDADVLAALRRRLPFRAILVASRTDPWATFAQSERYARDWGAELVDLGDAGHIDTGSGYGPWPEAERLIATLSAAH
ncbi:RBBP9/YdeN family alpha/beta hydrolase [Micromonospora cathayae]|uniref:Alpha/beta fold hydrolase n=1 Tax=Micromonospora cathayae TaxID=3028804 RepID=A0ABY7ZJ51_9ACTN|nr:alpha/beta hydrolase [Micromonospora sp. HUAS 3]WDZ82971.1 alpha/beta fold hydrolase [Micromonospora sp. HUAS 3]